jgi:serine/threonine protein kinase
LLERINIGGMAEVFKAKSFGVEGFEKLLAIKRILPNIAEDEDFITMFIDEAKIAVQLNHANIAQIYDLGKIEESYFIALEYVHGKDLRTIWDRHKKRGLLLPIPMSVYVVSRICEGLDYAHRKKDAGGRDLNIVHRDISPQNILISYEGEVKIIDFGIAKAANKASKTQAGILKGKFGYMSPEQVRGMPLDRRSDAFSVGIILYELLTGERLFVGESDFATLEKVRNVEILPPSTYNRKIPDTLEKIVIKALAKAPEDRYQSAYDMQEELQRFLILNKTNFARKDLANYMKRAFKADIERALQRQAEYQAITPEMAEEEAAPTSPGTVSPRVGAVQPPVARPQTPRPAPQPPPPRPAPDPPSLPVFAAGGDDDDDDEDIETVVFDPRQHRAEAPAAAPGATPPSDDEQGTFPGPIPVLEPPPPLPATRPVSQPRAPIPTRHPATSRGAPPLRSEPEESTGVTAPLGVSKPNFQPSRPGPAATRRGYDEDEPEAEPETRLYGEDSLSEATGEAFDQPARARPRLKLIIVALAAAALIVAGLATFKMLQQRGLLGGAASLSIQVSPANATVWVDGIEVGHESPVLIEGLAPGVHVVEASLDNYQPHQEEIELKVAEQASLDISLKFVAAGLELTYEPGDALVLIDGQKVAERSPFQSDALVSGKMLRIRVERLGFEPFEAEWTLEPQKKRQAQVNLKEILFSLEVTSEPPGAQVFLDDKPFGRTPTTVPGVGASQEHQLRLKHPRHPEWRSTIRHDGEPQQKVSARLAAETAALPTEGGPDRTAVAPGSEPGPARPVAVRPEPRPTPKKPRPKPQPAGKGTLTLNSKPWGDVIINGKNTGLRTPMLNYELPTGKHQVTIQFNTGGSKTIYVDIKADEKVKRIVNPD